MFTNRQDAGRRLAKALARYKDDHPVVLALPRGGVPVGFEVAKALSAPLDIIVVRKLGAPGQHELGIGAVVDGDHPQTVLNEELLRRIDVPKSYLEAEILRELEEIHRRQQTYRKGHPPVDPAGRIVIVVDDGIATGASIRAALRGLRKLAPRRLVLAVPVAPAETIESLRAEVDEVVCLATPPDFFAIGQYYDDFRQTSDAQVVELLDKARNRVLAPSPPAARSPSEESKAPSC
jgi:putative phosphoribosyl transferase